MDAKTYAEEKPRWTVAYRTTRNRGVFHRVSLELTWHQAVDMATYLVRVLDTAVWYVPNRQAELDGWTAIEDVQNVMVDSGRRVRIAEDGVLPFDTNPPVALWSEASGTPDPVSRPADPFATIPNAHSAYSDPAVRSAIRETVRQNSWPL
jgi:hypothetical protein